MPENRLVYPALDGLRAVAVLMVFLYHYEPAWPMTFGWTGVDVFFVLSGFLITGILFDTRYDSDRFRNFYGRRSLRIFPLYYGLFALLLLSTPLLRWNWDRSWGYWLLYLGPLSSQLFGTQLSSHLVSSVSGWDLELGHLWSLCVEEQFYLVWPLLVFWVKDRVTLRNLCFLGALAVPALRTGLILHDPARYLGTSALYWILPFRADSLLIGAGVALMLRGPEGTALRRSAMRIVVGCATAWILCWLIATHALHQDSPWRLDSPWIAAVGYTILALFAAGLILLAIQPETALYRWLKKEPLRRLGKLSYGFYLFHQIPRLMYFRLADRLIGRYTSHTAPLHLVIAFCCTYALAALSFRYFEAPFLRMKDRFSNKK